MLTQWISAEPGIDYPQGYYVNFEMSFLGEESEDSYAYCKIGSNVLGSIANGNSLTATQLVPFSQTLTFAIYNGSSVSSPGQLTITNFNASPVPAPLPAAGAASAFAISRRLRRRIKEERGRGGLRRRPAAPHPGSYLQLPLATLRTMPTSFSYSVSPRLGACGSKPSPFSGCTALASDRRAAGVAGMDVSRRSASASVI